MLHSVGIGLKFLIGFNFPWQVASWLKMKLAGSFHFSTKDIINAINLNFAPKFSNICFSPNFCTFGKKFRTSTGFFDNFQTAQN